MKSQLVVLYAVIVSTLAVACSHAEGEPEQARQESIEAEAARAREIHDQSRAAIDALRSEREAQRAATSSEIPWSDRMALAAVESANSLGQRYATEISSSVTAHWVVPATLTPGEACRVRIRQIAGGDVVSVTTDATCAYDEAARRSIEAAVLRASPLPYAGYESVFNPDIVFTFRAPE